jgi:hypothetical protein
MKFLIRVLTPYNVIEDEREVDGDAELVEALTYHDWLDMTVGSSVEVIVRGEKS